MNPTEEANVASVSTEIRLIRRTLDAVNGVSAVNRQLPAARSAMTLIDSTTLMDQSNRITDQAFIILELQRLAYHDQDSGGVQDVAEWCVAQWLRILQRSPESVETLSGV